MKRALHLTVLFLFSVILISSAEEKKGGLFNRIFGSNSEEGQVVSESQPVEGRTSRSLTDDLHDLNLNKEDLLDFAVDAAKHLDAIEKSIDEWGYASVGGLLVIEDSESGHVSFDYNRTFSENMDESSRVQGSASNAITKVKQTGVAVDVKSDDLQTQRNVMEMEQLKHEQKLNQLRQQKELLEAERELDRVRNGGAAGDSAFGEGGSGGSGGHGGGGGPGFGGGGGSGFSFDASNEVAPMTNAQELNTPNSQAAQQKGLSISLADQQKLAASATVTGQVLEMMSHPIGLPQNQRAFLGMAQISVSPGWRTAENYVCEIQVRARYATKGKAETPAAGEVNRFSYADSDLRYSETDFPMVFAAFPLSEAQVLDLRHSYREQVEFMAQIAATYNSVGANGQARFLREFVKQVQHDVATQSALPVIVPSSDGHFVTYRFDPSLQALGNPSKADSKSEFKLHAASSPVLIVIVCEREELDKWDRISLVTSTRWVPIEQEFLGLIDYRPKRLTNSLRLKNEINHHGELEGAMEWIRIESRKRGYSDPHYYFYDNGHEFVRGYQMIYNRYHSLKTLLSGLDNSVPLPKEDPPAAVLEVMPTSVPLSPRSEIVIKVRGFDFEDFNPEYLRVYVAGRRAEGGQVYSDPDSGETIITATLGGGFTQDEVSGLELTAPVDVTVLYKNKMAGLSAAVSLN